MIVLELERVEVDHCAACGGVWLDEGELELILDGEAGARNLIGSFASRRAAEKKRKCPVCRKAMEKVSCGPAGKTFLDKCKNGHGLWFDKGELDAVLREGCMGEERRVTELLKGMFGR